MLNLYELVSDPDKLKGSYDLACETVPQLAWKKYSSDRRFVPQELRKREHLWVNDHRLAMRYVNLVLQHRWPEAEPVIMKDPDTAYEYSKNILKRRWEEAEPVIMQTQYTSVWYMIHWKMSRRAEVEKMLLNGKSVMMIYNYTRHIIKGRWPEAEYKLLDPSLGWAEQYKELCGLT